MPFESEAQRKLCFAQMQRDIKAGRKVRWNCFEFGKGTKKSLPKYVSNKTSRKSSSKSTRPRKIHIGKLGGRYYITKGRKVYI